MAFADGRPSLTAVTTLIGESLGNISNPPAGIPGFSLNFASGAGGQVTYPNINFKWSSTPGAKRYEVAVEIQYTERIWADPAHTQLVSETEKGPGGTWVRRRPMTTRGRGDQAADQR